MASSDKQSNIALDPVDDILIGSDDPSLGQVNNPLLTTQDTNIECDIVSLNEFHEYRRRGILLNAIKKYAANSRFEVRKYTTRLSHQRVVGKYFVCNKQGVNPKKKSSNTNNSSGSATPNDDYRKRYSGRTNCRAQFHIRITASNMYVLDTFEEKHNHMLVSATDMHLLKSSRKLTFTQQSFMHSLSNYNIGPNKAHRIMSEIVGSSDKVGASIVDCKNFKRDILEFIGESDAQMAVQKLMYKKECLNDFSFEVLCDDDGALSAMFWADEIAKSNYYAFGDVVSFDATFRTNKYKMVFVPFTGIDNHKKCVTFGAGLLSSETIDSYAWLLNAFGRQPEIVLTDQDPAMRQAIVDVFPMSRHRLCMWHVTNKLTTKVGSKICSTTNFRKRFNDLVWNENIEDKEFELLWGELIAEFDLGGNKWLSDMFDIRDRWIPAFFHDTHLSGLMRTTSCSESENNFFQKLMNANLTLVEFLSHFETAMEFQRAAQRLNDHISHYKSLELRTKLVFERQASQLYTLSMFATIQHEIQACNDYCICMMSYDIEGGNRYIVNDTNVEETTHANFEVIFLYDPIDVKCSCSLFERKGILCRHAFFVLRMCKVKEIPNRYVLRRWTKDVPSMSFQSKRPLIPGIKEPNITLTREILSSVDLFLNRIIGDIDMLSEFYDKQKALMDEFEELLIHPKELKKKDVIETLIGVPRPDELTIHVPTGIRNKGCGSRKRLISARDQAISKAVKKKRQCRCCNSLADHDSRNCPHKNNGSC